MTWTIRDCEIKKNVNDVIKENKKIANAIWKVLIR